MMMMMMMIRCCANRRSIYDFLLALNSNSASIFNRSRYIIEPKSSLYNLLPLNSPTHYLFIIISVYFVA